MDREALILSLMPQVRLIAALVHRGLPTCVPLDDVISAGTLGAIAAVDNYDQRPGVELKTYANHKIRGAILDSLRAMDWATRWRRDRWDKINAAAVAIEREQQRDPTEAEIAARLGMSLAELREQRRGADTTLLSDYSLEHGVALRDSIPDTGPLADSLLAASADARRVKDALARLSERDQEILQLYFYQDLTLRAIAERLGTSTPRICQLRFRALARLRAHFGVRPIPQRISRPRLRGANEGPQLAEAA